MGASLAAEVERNTRLLTEPAARDPHPRVCSLRRWIMRASPRRTRCRALVATDFFGTVGYSAPRRRNPRLPPLDGREAGIGGCARLLLERCAGYHTGSDCEGPADSSAVLPPTQTWVTPRRRLWRFVWSVWLLMVRVRSFSHMAKHYRGLFARDRVWRLVQLMALRLVLPGTEAVSGLVGGVYPADGA